MPRKAKCENIECRNNLPEEYYSILRTIKTGNKRRRFNFCSLDCLVQYARMSLFMKKINEKQAENKDVSKSEDPQKFQSNSR